MAARSVAIEGGVEVFVGGVAGLREVGEFEVDVVEEISDEMIGRDNRPGASGCSRLFLGGALELRGGCDGMRAGLFNGEFGDDLGLALVDRG